MENDDSNKKDEVFGGEDHKNDEATDEEDEEFVGYWIIKHRISENKNQKYAKIEQNIYSARWNGYPSNDIWEPAIHM